MFWRIILRMTFKNNQMSCQHKYLEVIYIFFSLSSYTHKERLPFLGHILEEEMMTSYWHTLKQTPIIIVFLPSRHGLYAHCSIDNIPFSLSLSFSPGLVHEWSKRPKWILIPYILTINIYKVCPVIAPSYLQQITNTKP